MSHPFKAATWLTGVSDEHNVFNRRFVPFMCIKGGFCDSNPVHFLSELSEWLLVVPKLSFQEEWHLIGSWASISTTYMYMYILLDCDLTIHPRLVVFVEHSISNTHNAQCPGPPKTHTLPRLVWIQTLLQSESGHTHVQSSTFYFSLLTYLWEP